MTAVSMLAGCTGYAPLDLDGTTTEAALAAPDEPAITAAAGGLRQPRIPPITLDFSKPLTGDELAVIAVLVNPELKALRFHEGVADAQVFDAGLLPDPTLTVGLDRPTSSQPGLVNAYNVGVSWDLLGLLTRRAARRVAEARRQQTRDDIAWHEWMVANQARLQALRVDALEAQLALARSAAETARRLLEVSRRDLERRDVTIDRLALREVAYLDARDRELAFARDLEKARQALNQELGLPPDTRLALARQTPAERSGDTATALFAQARVQRLDLLALRAGYLAQEQQLQHDLLARFPQINLGLHQARDTGDVVSIGFAVGVTIPVFNGGRGTVAVARATRRQLQSEYVARLFQTRADIASLVADLERIEREIEPLVAELPSLRHAASTMREGVTSGDVTLLGFETVRANLLAKELQLLALEQARGEQRIALQLTTGAPWPS